MKATVVLVALLASVSACSFFTASQTPRQVTPKHAECASRAVIAVDAVLAVASVVGLVAAFSLETKSENGEGRDGAQIAQKWGILLGGGGAFLFTIAATWGYAAIDRCHDVLAADE